MLVPFVRSKGRKFRLRDAESGKVLEVGPLAWVKLGALPRGMMPQDDTDVEVRLAKCDEDVAALQAENVRLAAMEEQRIARRRERAHALDPEKTPTTAPDVKPLEVEVPTFEEVIKAGYEERVAHAIVARQKALAAGKTADEAEAEAHAAVDAYDAAHPQASSTEPEKTVESTKPEQHKGKHGRR